MHKLYKKLLAEFICLILILVTVFFVSRYLVNRVKLKNELNKYDLTYEKILGVCTKSFIGNHPIDDNFMIWYISTYGESNLDAVVDNMDFEDPDVWYALTGKSIHTLWYEYCCDSGLESYELQNTHELTTASSDEASFLFTGDLSLADGTATTNYMNKQTNGLQDCFSTDLFNMMTDADLLFVNNEFCYTTRGEAVPGKDYTFRANPKSVNQLFSIGCDLVGLANNHVYDYQKIGLQDTFNTLKQANMPYVGAGNNLSEASQAQYYIVNGKKVAIIATSQIERSKNYTKAADETSEGVLKCLEPSAAVAAIKYAKKQSDYVIVVAHWGTEHTENYGADQKSLANKFVEAGADVIVGGHTHCLQGVDIIDDVPIFYSLGNYWFATSQNMPKDYVGGLASVTIDSEGEISASLIPTQFSKGKTSLITEGSELSSLYTSLNEVSGDAKLSDKGQINKKGLFD